jgi:hypothetical protein
MDKNKLIKDRISSNTAEVEIPGVGKVVVRGLSRYELLLSGKNTEDVTVIERRTLATALVDPRMSEADVEQWQKNSPASEIGPVTKAIQALSGLGEGAAKSDDVAAGE